MAKANQKKKDKVGTWTELEESTSKVQESYVIWNETKWEYSYRMIKYGEMDEIVEELSEEPGIKDNPIKYERRKQELMLWKIVTVFAGAKMQTDTGDPIDSNWMKMPAPIFEQLRMSFFRSTGEVMNKLGIDEDGVKVLKKIMDELVDEAGFVIKDGKIVEQNKKLKK